MKRSFAFLMVMSAAFAQDTAPEEKKDPGSLLTDAVLHFRAQNELVVSANVTHAKPDAKGGQGFGGIVVVAGPGGQMADPFEGKVSAWRDAQGVTVIQSLTDLPGFSLYVSDERSIQQVTFEDKRPSLKQIEAELTSLLESDRFVKRVMAAREAGNFTATANAESGDVTFTGPIDREIVRPVSNAMQVGGMVVGNLGMQSRVLRAEATLLVSKDGKFKSAAIKLVRSDTLAGLKSGVIVRGGGVIQVEQKKRDEKHDVEGGSTTYTLTFGEQKPAERARDFKRQIQRMLGAK